MPPALCPTSRIDGKFRPIDGMATESGKTTLIEVLLATLADEPGRVQMNTGDAKALGVKDGELVWIESRRGRVMSRAEVSERTNQGAVYMTYQWWIGACNELTIDHLDPISRTPEFKHSAVRVEKIADQKWAERHVLQVYGDMKDAMRKAALA